MKDTITKTIVFEFTNSFTKAVMVTISQPYIPFLATQGRYSGFYKGAKYAAAVGCEPSQVVGKKWFENKKINRTVIALGSGISLDIPHDLSKKDCDIIEHHLRGFKMACTP